MVKDPADLKRIEQALPQHAVVPPAKPRKLLLFCLNVNYGGHPSIHYANQAFALMGEKTGAFQTVISRDPSVFQPQALKQFDAVFFNNTVGNLFEDPRLRQNLLEFVCGGGGLLGVHGSSVAFTQWPGAREDWPEFGLMIGTRGANHRDSDEHLFLKLDDADHPVNRVFDGQGFDYRDEFFRVHDPYSRNRVRVLLSIDVAKCDPNQGQARGDCVRADNDYALAWVRSYGRGRVFYCTIAHNPYVFWDPKMLQFYQAAIQFALGDLPAPTTPSARLTAAVRAQEKLGWRLGLEAGTFPNQTLFEVIDRTAQLGLGHLSALSSQQVGPEIAKPFDSRLSDDELRQIRFKLDAAGVRLLAYHLGKLPADEAGRRGLFEFGRKMGIEAFIAAPPPEALPSLEKLCDEYDIKLALCDGGTPDSRPYRSPEDIIKVCRGRSKRIGASGDVGQWMRSGIDPLKATRTLKDRLLTLQVHDLHARGRAGHDVPWGTGVGQTERLLAEIRTLGLSPTVFGLGYSSGGADPTSGLAECIRFFNTVSLSVAK